MNKKFLVLAIAAVLPSAAFADGIEDFYHQVYQQRFFNNPTNARVLGMGGSSGVTSTDSSSVASNPAGIGMMKDAEISAGYSYEQLSGNDVNNYEDTEQESHNGSVMGAVPIVPYTDALPEYGNVGLGWSGDHRTADDVNDSDARTYRLMVAYGKSVSDDLSLGYGVGYIHDKFETGSNESKMTDGVRQTVGALYNISNATRWGLDTFYGFGESEQPTGGFFDGSSNGRTKRDLKSWGIESGLSHAYNENTNVAFSTDYVNYDSEDDDSNAWGFHLGGEQKVADWLKLRAGYRYQMNRGFDTFDPRNQNAKFNAVSFGADIPLGGAFIDYGAEYRMLGDNDWTHMISLGVPFSLCE